MKVTVEVPSDLYKKIQLRKVRESRPVKELITEALERSLGRA